MPSPTPFAPGDRVKGIAAVDQSIDRYGVEVPKLGTIDRVFPAAAFALVEFDDRLGISTVRRYDELEKVEATR